MLELIKRRTPELLEHFVIDEIPAANGHDTYEIDSDGKRVILRGNNTVAKATAYYRYLRDYCNVSLSWCSNHETYEIKNAPLPDKAVKQVLLKDRRMCFSYETYADSACWWEWERWERELDYLAMNGVNMFLCLVGYEAVWYYSMLKVGLNREDSLTFLSGPCYYPLQLDGKLDTFLPLVDTDYLKKRIELGQKIVARARELGIAPVMQGFNGHVPKLLKGYFTKADIVPVTAFEKFAFTYRISPVDPLFEKLAQALNEKQEELFGKADYYISNPFSGVKTLSRNPLFPARYGTAVHSAIKAANGKAIWVLSAESYSPQLVKNVPSNELLVLDIDGICDENSGFDGHLFLLGARFNFGGHTTLHGNIKELAGNRFAVVSRKHENCVGCGMFPDSTDVNPMYSDMAMQMLTVDGEISLQQWTKRYAYCRWGSNEKCLADAAQIIADCMGERCVGRETGSIIASRPSTEITHTAPFDTLELRYDNRELCRALGLMLESKGDYTDGYVFDVCDVTRQVMSNYARELYSAAIKGYQNSDARLFEVSSNAFMKLLEEMDGLLSAVPELRLGTHLQSAADCTVGRQDKQNFELNLLCRISLFGPFSTPEYYDCAWREWADVVGGYYSKRWREFFELLAKDFKKKKRISTVTRKQINGRNLSRGNSFYKKLDSTERKWITKCRAGEPGDEDALKIAEKLYEKYSALVCTQGK